MKKILNILKNLAFLAVGVFLFWRVYRNENFSDVATQVSKIKYLYLIVAFFVAILSHWFRATRWVLLIKPLGYKVSHFNAFLAVMIGYFANIAIPRLGEVSRCVVLNRTNKINVDKLIGTVIIERLVDVISLLLILILTLILQFNKISGFVIEFYNRSINPSGESGKLFTTGMLIIVIAVILFLVGAIVFLYSKFKEHALVKKVLNMVDGFKTGFMTISKLDNLWMFILQSALIWVMYYFMVYICFFALPSTAGLGPTIALVVLCMGSFGFVAPVPGGVGAYHVIVTQTLMLYGLSQEDSRTFALVAHTFQEMVIILIGGFSFIYFSIAFKKLKANDLPESHKAEVIS